MTTRVIYIRQPPPQYIYQQTPVDLYHNSTNKINKLNKLNNRVAELNKLKMVLENCTGKKSMKKLCKVNKKMHRYNRKVNKQTMKIKKATAQNETLRRKAANYLNIK